MFLALNVVCCILYCLYWPSNCFDILLHKRLTVLSDTLKRHVINLVKVTVNLINELMSITGCRRDVTYLRGNSR